MDNPLASLSAIVLLLLANGFFVAAEFALVKAKGFRIDALSQGGSAAARLTLQIQDNIEAYLAACQLGITMASLGLGWIGEPAVAALLEPLFRWFSISESILHPLSFLLGFVIFSSLHIVIGEQVPKTLAIRTSEPVALRTAYPLHGFFLLAFPLNWALNRTTNAILGLLNVKQVTHGEVLSGEEIKDVIDISEEHGHLEEDKAEMLRNLLEFDERTVSRVMLPQNQVDHINLTAPLEETVRIMRETQHSRFPVVDGDVHNPVGVILVKDLYTAVLSGESTPWESLRSYLRKPLVVPETLRIGRLFDTMREAHAHMALVVDEYGGFTGLVTLEDLLEEIVGEIVDELDKEASHPWVRVSENQWEVQGLAPLADLHRALGIEFPHDIEANTLSGLFMQVLGRMPESGDEIQLGDFHLEVMSMLDRHVEMVRLRK